MEKKTGLFRVSYKIGGDKPGAPNFLVHFFVYTPGKKVTGMGEIKQTTNPPTDIHTQFDDGDYTYMCVMPPKNCRILIHAKGHLPNGIPANVNVYLTLNVTEDWQSGIANYRYCDAKGNWHEVENAPVTVIPGDTIY